MIRTTDQFLHNSFGVLGRGVRDGPVITKAPNDPTKSSDGSRVQRLMEVGIGIEIGTGTGTGTGVGLETEGHISLPAETTEHGGECHYPSSLVTLPNASRPDGQIAMHYKSTCIISHRIKSKGFHHHAASL